MMTRHNFLKGKPGMTIRWIAIVAAVLLVSAGAQRIAAAVDYKSTGVSREERKAYPGYPLKLVFATYEGALMAGVKVDIIDDSGESVLSLSEAGPWLLVDLAPGEYDVKVEGTHGMRTSARVDVPEQGRTEVVLSLRDTEDR